jgi:hypothetical protein
MEENPSMIESIVIRPSPPATANAGEQAPVFLPKRGPNGQEIGGIS